MPDPLYNSQFVTQIINVGMRGVKKTVAERIIEHHLALTNVLGLDLASALAEKMEKNAEK